MPRLLTSTNSGTSVTIPGIISVASTSRNSQVRPQKSILANAYPSIEQNTRLPSVTDDRDDDRVGEELREVEPREQLPEVVERRVPAATRWAGWRAARPSVLNDPSSIQTNGVTTSTRPMPSTA